MIDLDKLKSYRVQGTSYKLIQLIINLNCRKLLLLNWNLNFQILLCYPD
jgi:hypothetical protein